MLNILINTFPKKNVDLVNRFVGLSKMHILILKLTNSIM